MNSISDQLHSYHHSSSYWLYLRPLVMRLLVMSNRGCGHWVVGIGQCARQVADGVLPFTEAEYDLWEEHWTECAMRLQQWDILSELSKNEGNCDVMAECAWRNVDWCAERDMIGQILSGVSEANPRKRVFECFREWNRLQDPNERTQENVS
jgi:transformation/transcription domain-associated protein